MHCAAVIPQSAASPKAAANPCPEAQAVPLASAARSGHGARQHQLKTFGFITIARPVAGGAKACHAQFHAISAGTAHLRRVGNAKLTQGLPLPQASENSPFGQGFCTLRAKWQMIMQRNLHVWLAPRSNPAELPRCKARTRGLVRHPERDENLVPAAS